MHDLYIQYQTFLTGNCFLGLLVLAAMVFAYWTGVLGDLFRRITHLPRLGKAVSVVMVVGMAIFAVSKQGAKVTYDGGIVMGDEPNLITNSTVFITWKKDPHNPLPLPSSAAVYIDYRPNASTNDFGLLAQSTVGAGSWLGELENATNYEYQVWAYYIPPAPHTNGVWEYKTTYSRDGSQIVPFGARIEVGGKAIAMPDQKRKDEEGH